MTVRVGQGDSAIPVTLFIVAVSSIVSTVTGFGVFHVNILSVDVSSSPLRCSSGEVPPCKLTGTTCRNNTLVFTACLSHHQLPLPFKLQCTLGREVLIVSVLADVNSNDSLWKPDALIVIPFTFSWPGGFSLSVSVAWGCHAQELRDSSVFSSIVVADHIAPSRQWTAFTNHLPSTGQTRFPSQSRPDIGSSKMLTHNRVSRQGDHASPDLGTLSKIYYVNSSYSTNTNTSSLQKSVSDVSSRESDSNHTVDHSHANYTATKIFVKRSNVSTTNIQRRFRSDTSDVGSDSSTSGQHQRMSRTAVVRLQGPSLFMAARVVCQDHYFGNSCSTLCRPRDDLLGHYSCSEEGGHVCLPGWAGDDCTEAVCSERCSPSRGECTRPLTCTCRHGWFGEHCDRCRTYPGCKHGTCHLPGQCVCHKGWTGPLCDVEELYCLEHRPCQNGGKCLHDGFYNYTCSCPAGYTGTHCEVPLCHDHFCLHGGMCQIGEGTRYCLCQPPFAGPRCQHRQSNMDIQSSNIPCHGGSCSSRNHTFHQQTHVFDQPCQDAGCLSHLLKPVSCQGRVCYNNGTCFRSPGSQIHECQCSFPFTGPRCLQVHDPCQSSPCQNEAVCKTTDPYSGSFICVCALGFSGDTCHNKTLAHSPGKTICGDNLVCQNGGICEKWQRSGQFFCKCLLEFTGEFCEIDNTDPCSGHTCLNEGTCVLGQHNEPGCVCKDGYTGHFCQSLPESVCSRHPCQNGGTCHEHDGEFVCSCRKQFEGVYCEKRFRRRETALTVRFETLTVRDEKLQVKVENVEKSGGAINSANRPNLVFVLVTTWIMWGMLTHSRTHSQTHVTEYQLD